MKMPYSQKLIVNNKYNDKLETADFLTLFAIAVVSLCLGFIITQTFFAFVIALVITGIGYAMISPSGEFQKKNYQKILTVVFKDRTTYHSFDRPENRWW